jgi:hypothetical protein
MKEKYQTWAIVVFFGACIIWGFFGDKIEDWNNGYQWGTTNMLRGTTQPLREAWKAMDSATRTIMYAEEPTTDEPLPRDE